LPDYLHYITKQQLNTKNAQIDTEIVKALFSFNLNITKTFDEVCQDILNKRNTDYCGAYELMKHDKLKSECFKIAGQKPKQNNFVEKKKIGKFKSIQKIIDKNREINDMVSQLRSGSRIVSLNDQALKAKKKIGSLTMSTAHLQRLNKIHERFQRDDEHQMSMMKNQTDTQWLNYQKYENPKSHSYPKNPFSTNDRNVQQLVAQQQ
jgi:hypothetical protein